jgi:hypothetical protein
MVGMHVPVEALQTVRTGPLILLGLVGAGAFLLLSYIPY